MTIRKGRLCFGGADVVKLASEFGTPLYIVDENVLRGNCRAYKESFEAKYPNVTVILASKALMTLAVARIAASEGLAIDVASIGEMRGGVLAGVDPANMFYHGNFKKKEDLETALAWGIGCIVLDSAHEAEMLDKIARAKGITQKVLLRITPGVEAHVHEMVQVGKLDTKFGMPIESGLAFDLVKKITKLKNLDFFGIHYHIGSQILDPDPFRVSVQTVVAFMKELKGQLGLDIRALNVGGGYPVRYATRQALPAPEKFANAITSEVKKQIKANGLILPHLYLEPGRALVGPAGMTIYTVGPVKDIPGVRTYVSVDGGLSDNPRPALYDSVYEAVIANRADAKKGFVTCRVSGRHCETDTLIKDIDLASPVAGDILAVFTTGAYNHAMSSNYNKFPRPAMVLVNNGKADLIIARETYDELYRNDIIPERLK